MHFHFVSGFYIRLAAKLMVILHGLPRLKATCVIGFIPLSGGRHRPHGTSSDCLLKVAIVLGWILTEKCC